MKKNYLIAAIIFGSSLLSQNAIASNIWELNQYKKTTLLESDIIEGGGYTLYPVPNTIEEVKKDKSYHSEDPKVTLNDICEHPLINENLKEFLIGNRDKKFEIGDSININGSELRITQNHKMSLNGILSESTSINYFWDYLNYEKKEERIRKIALSVKTDPSANIETIKKYISFFKKIVPPYIMKAIPVFMEHSIMMAIPVYTQPPIMTTPPKSAFIPYNLNENPVRKKRRVEESTL